MNLRNRLAIGTLALALPLGAAGRNAVAQEQATAAQADAPADAAAPDYPVLTNEEIQRIIQDRFDAEKAKGPDDYANFLINAACPTFAITDYCGDDVLKDEQKNPVFKKSFPELKKAFNDYLFKTVLNVSETVSDENKTQAVINLMSGHADKSLNVSDEALKDLQTFRVFQIFTRELKTRGPDKFITDFLLPALFSKPAAKEDKETADIRKYMKSLFSDDEKTDTKGLLSNVLKTMTLVSGDNDNPNPSRATFELLTKMGGDILQKDNKNGENLIFDPAKSGNLEMVRMLHELGVPVTQPSFNGALPMSRSLENPQMVKLLLELGAPAEGRLDDDHKETYLLHSLQLGKLESAKALIDHYANINAKIGEEPLVVAFLENPVSTETEKTGLKMLLAGKENNKLDPRTRAANGDDLYVTLSKHLWSDDIDGMMGCLALHGVETNLDDPLVASQLRNYTDNIRLGRELRNFTSFTTLPPDRYPIEYILAAIAYSDNNENGVSFVQGVLSNSDIARDFTTKGSKLLAFSIAMRENPAVFAALLRDNPDVLIKKDPDDKSFADEIMLRGVNSQYIDSLAAQNIIAQIDQVTKMGGTIDIEEWKKTLRLKKNEDERLAARPIIAHLEGVDEPRKNQADPGEPVSVAPEPSAAPVAAADTLYAAIITGDMAKIAQAGTDALHESYVTDRTISAIGDGMHLAAAAGRIDAAVALKNRGLSYDAPNNFGETPVVDAVRGGQVAMFNFLSDQQVDLGVRTQTIGWTLLDWAVDYAAQNHDGNIVDAVLAAGIFRHIEKSDVQRAIRRANDFGHPEIAGTISAALADFRREPAEPPQLNVRNR